MTLYSPTSSGSPNAAGESAATTTGNDAAPILLVDDNVANLMSFETILAELGEPISRASTGGDALRQLLASDYAVIVLDVNLPDMTGFETAALIRGRPRSQVTPIIFVSAISTDEAHAFRGYSMGAVDYIFAPTVPEVLRTKVRVFVELYKQRRQVQRQAEQLRELREREHRRAMFETSERLRLALIAGRMGVWEADMQTRLLSWSPIPGGIAGVDPSTAWSSLDQLTASLITPAHEAFAAALERCSAGETELNLELPLTRDGATLWVELRARYFQEDGRARIFGVYADITERKRGEEEIRVARDQAQEANRAKDRFLATLSHELRTPLTPALLAAQSWSQADRLPDGLRADLRMIVASIETESRLIDDLLDLTYISRNTMTLSRRMIDAHEVIRLALRALEAPPNHTLCNVSVSCNAERPGMFADPVRLQQVVWNVVGNAIKFSTEPPIIHVRTHNDSAGRFVLEVADKGVGIRSDYLARIFGAFEKAPTANRKFGGLGLGLAICKNIVELHEGTIEAESDGPGKGTTVRVILPTAPDTGSASAADSLENSGCTGVRILLIEDHANTAEVLSRLLTLNGHNVTVGTSVQEALALFSGANFDLVVSDVGLPDGTGFDLLERIRAQSDIPAIALTGHGQPEDVTRSRDAGFNSHLTKPVDLNALQAVMDRLLSTATN